MSIEKGPFEKERGLPSIVLKRFSLLAFFWRVSEFWYPSSVWTFGFYIPSSSHSTELLFVWPLGWLPLMLQQSSLFQEEFNKFNHWSCKKISSLFLDLRWTFVWKIALQRFFLSTIWSPYTADDEPPDCKQHPPNPTPRAPNTHRMTWFNNIHLKLQRGIQGTQISVLFFWICFLFLKKVMIQQIFNLQDPARENQDATHHRRIRI